MGGDRMKRKAMKRINPVAKALWSPVCKPKVIVDKKTVYNRKRLPKL